MLQILFSVIICLLMPTLAIAKPLWEAGVGLAGLHHPHYLGADQEYTALLPIPYFVYRGERIKADQSGLRSLIYDSNRLDLRLSLGASLPVNSDDNDARKGMDDIDLIVEAGPTLQYTLFQNDKHLLRADWPIRAAFTLGNQPFNHQGWTTTPQFYYQSYYNQWKVDASLGAVYSDRRHHGYTFNVDQDEVTAIRSFYRASSGYTGLRFSLGTRRRMGDFVWGANFRYYNLSDSVNSDSDLLRKEDYASLSFVIVWIFKESTDQAAQ